MVTSLCDKKFSQLGHQILVKSNQSNRDNNTSCYTETIMKLWGRNIRFPDYETLKCTYSKTKKYA